MALIVYSLCPVNCWSSGSKFGDSFLVGIMYSTFSFFHTNQKLIFYAVHLRVLKYKPNYALPFKFLTEYSSQVRGVLFNFEFDTISQLTRSIELWLVSWKINNLDYVVIVCQLPTYNGKNNLVYIKVNIEKIIFKTIALLEMFTLNFIQSTV